MSSKQFNRIISFAVLGLMFTTTTAAAQEAINFDSALQPAKDMLIVRQQFGYWEAENNLGANKLDLNQFQLSTSLIYGIEADLTVMFNAPLRFREIENNTTGISTRDEGLGDLAAILKYQFYQNDTGPTDTARLSSLAGLEIRSGDSNFSSDSYDPLLGLVYTQSQGRHGYNLAALWKINLAEGASDRLRYDAAYVYRLAPEEYSVGKLTALFGVLELNGVYEANGDNEIFLAPGIQYVTKDWALEATVQLPVWQELNERMEKDFVIGIGWRMQF